MPHDLKTCCLATAAATTQTHYAFLFFVRHHNSHIIHVNRHRRHGIKSVGGGGGCDDQVKSTLSCCFGSERCP